MKKTFTKEYIDDNAGCYKGTEKLTALLKSAPQEIIIEDVVHSTIPLKDKFWFVCRKCELTKKQSVEITVGCAEIVLPIFEEKYPNNKSVRECIEATKLFMKGYITVEQLLLKRKAAYADAYAADAYADADAYAASAAGYAAAAAAAYAADAYAYAAAASASAHAAAAAYADDYAAGDSKYIQQLFDFLLNFIKNN